MPCAACGSRDLTVQGGRLVCQTCGWSPQLAAALFCTDQQPSSEPTCSQVRHAAELTLLIRGPQVCAGRVAQEYGDHPELAATRMAWCRAVVAEAYTPVSTR